jgi:hypothetical protein
MRNILIAALMALPLAGQTSNVKISQEPPPLAVVKQFYYDGSNNLTYVCSAKQNNVTTAWRRSNSTLTSIVVTTNTAVATTASAHGLYIGARVTVSGATVDTDLNGTYTITAVSDTGPYTFTFTTSGVTGAPTTYNESTLAATTTYPVLTSAVWAIQVLIYNASNLVTGTYFANSNVGYGLACSARTTY